ncbi:MULTISPECIES: chemotaxis protein [unclassified Yoonia]|uniref:chemotaxis protein n=1 Tax=unclassified Yoonia TaxID=2629118 RepID=UPI002AFFA2EB|nr:MULTISPECIES: chemotaxis protein [unclassified Yoonia]
MRPLDNIATALREIATIVTRLEDTALSMCSCETDLSQKTKSLQDFDLVLQSLADLASLLDAMGEQTENETTSDSSVIIARMRLAWLRDLIGDATPRADHDQPRIAIF